MAKRKHWLRRHYRLAALLLLLAMSVGALYRVDLSPAASQMTYGMTFSQEQATKAGLNWQETYTAMLDDLAVDHVRLIARWDQIEPEPDKFNYLDLDWQMNEAAKRNVSVILSMGQRVPRWPECFVPEWAQKLDSAAYQAQLIEYLAMTATRYSTYRNLINWQVENEPFLDSFGSCPKGNSELLRQEIAAVKKIDYRPIITTDSGELGLWYKAAREADIFGTTMYRKVWNKYIGFFTWGFPPAIYALKSKLLAANKPVYVMELQAEPWGSNFRFITDIPIDEQLAEFNQQNLLANVDYAERSGFNTIYLWGAEWWYWLKQNGHPELWDTAKQFWPGQK